MQNGEPPRVGISLEYGSKGGGRVRGGRILWDWIPVEFYGDNSSPAAGSSCCHIVTGEMVCPEKAGSDASWDPGGVLPTHLGPMEQSNATVT